MASKAEIMQGWGGWPSEMHSIRAVQAGGWAVHGLAEIVNVCGSLALRAPAMEILQV
jgi:hypothetical protein